MNHTAFDELQKLGRELDAAQDDAAALVQGLDAAGGAWRREPGSWSIAECLDHLATANRVYLRVMQPAADHARQRGRLRRGPALPGILGRLFIKWMEPPVRPRMRGKSPRLIRPREQPPLENAYADFLQQQDQVRAFIDGVRGRRSGRRHVPESIRRRAALEPGDRPARHHVARTPASVAGLERAAGDGRGGRVASP